MKLTIVHTTASTSFVIDWLEVDSSVGNFVFQDGQAPMILILAAHQPIRYKLQDGKEESYDIPSGILHINRTEATIVITHYVSVLPVQ